MKDLKLDFENKTVINDYVDKKQRVSQQIKLAINVWTQDWMLDETFGVDYDSSWGNQQLMENYIRAQILQVAGVKTISKFTIERIADENNVYFKIDTTVVYNGEVLDISETVGN